MKKKIKIPLKLVISGLLFSKVERVWPWLAHRWFVRIFFSTARFELPTGEKECMDLADKSTFNFEGKKIQVYTWGVGKPVLLVHGWMVRATQFQKFIPAFNAAGYQVVSFDSTGHGLSDGNKSHLMEFAGIIKMLSDHIGSFEMVVGHSLGGVASLHAVKNYGVTSRLVMLASPVISQEIVDEFRKKIGASKGCEGYFNQYIEKKFGHPFEHYSGSYIISDVKNIDLFLVYDENDKEVSMKNPAVMKERYPEAKVLVTEGLGHNRILKDEGVIESTLKFLDKTEAISV